MNAIVALCQFCEAHGPTYVFCTQTLRDTKLENLPRSPENSLNQNCAACTSLGNGVGMLSKDSESNTNFLSTQVPVIAEVVPLVKQAAIRSLSCEVLFSLFFQMQANALFGKS